MQIEYKIFRMVSHDSVVSELNLKALNINGAMGWEVLGVMSDDVLILGRKVVPEPAAKKRWSPRNWLPRGWG